MKSFPILSHLLVLFAVFPSLCPLIRQNKVGHWTMSLSPWVLNFKQDKTKSNIGQRPWLHQMKKTNNWHDQSAMSNAEPLSFEIQKCDLNCQSNQEKTSHCGFPYNTCVQLPKTRDDCPSGQVNHGTASLPWPLECYNNPVEVRIWHFSLFICAVSKCVHRSFSLERMSRDIILWSIKYHKISYET